MQLLPLRHATYQNLARIVHFVIQASYSQCMKFHFGIRTNIRYGTISEMDLVDQEFRISYVLPLNSITVKNTKLHQKRVYYSKADRKLYNSSYLSNYEHF